MSQKQSAGDGAVVVQAGGSVTISTGPSIDDIRQIALEVLRANFIEVQGIAKQVVDERFSEFTDDFLRRLSEVNPSSLAVMQDPDIQYSFCIAGRDYARSGDKTQEQLLIDLLIEKCASTNRSLQSIVLSEAISTVSKLTSVQMSALAASWAIHHLSNLKVKSADYLKEVLSTGVAPFIDGMLINYVDQRHLVYSGCATGEFVVPNFGSIYRSRYPGLFQRGLDDASIPENWREFEDEILEPSPLGDNRFWIKAISLQDARDLASNLGHPEWEDAFIDHLKYYNNFEEDKISDQIIVSLLPELSPVIDGWKDGSFSGLSITSVGIAIGHAHWVQKTGIKYPLAYWIPDGV